MVNGKRRLRPSAWEKKKPWELLERLPYTVKWHEHPLKHMDAVTHNPEQFNLVRTQIHCTDGAPGQFTNYHGKYTQLRCRGTASNGSEESGQKKPVVTKNPHVGRRYHTWWIHFRDGAASPRLRAWEGNVSEIRSGSCEENRLNY